MSSTAKDRTHSWHCVNGGNMQISIKSILMPELWGQMKITGIETLIGNSRTDKKGFHYFNNTTVPHY